MQVEAQEFLSLVEETNRICFFDLESTGFNGDYCSILTVSILPYKDKKPITFAISKTGQDKKVVKATIEEMNKYSVWVGYYSKMFDVPMINTRATLHGLAPLEKKPHLDMYFLLRSRLNCSRRSQAHYLDWFNLSEKKMTLSPDEWNQVHQKGTKVMQERSESDVRGLRGLYDRTKHLVINVAK